MTAPPQPSPQALHGVTADYRERRYAEAFAGASALFAAFPENLSSAVLLGASARALGRLEEAEAAFRAALGINPASSDARFNLALVQADRGDEAGAVASYRTLLETQPDHVQALNNLAAALTRRGECAQALALLDRAIGLRPRLALLHHSRGNALRRSGAFGEAVEAYRDALALNPGLIRARYNIALLEQERGDPVRAIEGFREVLAREPDHALAQAQLIHQYAHHCDWDALAGHMATIPALGIDTAPLPPFPLLALEDEPARHLLRAQRWSRQQFPEVAPPVRAASAQRRPERLKIAYFSADFYDHPMMQLITGPLRAHDRERFEVHAFSFGRKRNDEGRRKAERLADHFHDVFDWPDHAIVEKTRALGIDIAIDHDGHTRDSRSGLFAHRLAPVQVNYLGYTGSMGADFIDYIIADHTVIPAAEREHYQERVIWLPDTYFPTDNAIARGTDPGTRADYGLPESGPVLCCFNGSYKFGRREFAIWMRVLAAIEGSVLWLRGTNDIATRNLRREAEAHGIDPERLVFSQRVPLAQHLARHRLADLFLDSFHYNAHTTAADALWAGLPVVTRAGRQFSARGGASILGALDMQQLVTRSDAEYEALIVALLRDPKRLSQVRERLADRIESAALFDTARYTRHLEAGLEQAYDRWLAGEALSDIEVADLSGR